MKNRWKRWTKKSFPRAIGAKLRMWYKLWFPDSSLPDISLPDTSLRTFHSRTVHSPDSSLPDTWFPSIVAKNASQKIFKWVLHCCERLDCRTVHTQKYYQIYLFISKNFQVQFPSKGLLTESYLAAKRRIWPSELS